MLSKALTLPVATLYAELHDLSVYDWSSAREKGSFSVKTINGQRYWYHQRWLGKRRLQKLLGRETPQLLAQIETAKKTAALHRQESSRRRELCRALKAGLRMNIEALSGKVIAELAEKGFFQAGAMLIGTHAYVAYAAVLGRKLSQANVRTGDLDFAVVDIAADRSMSFPEIIKSVDDAFFQVPAPPGSTLSTALKYRGGEARVELLTPHRGIDDDWAPVPIASLAFGAQQIPFLDYLLEDAIEATYLYADGVRVRVPDPARFALHKLIVGANRSRGEAAKSRKDFAQSDELIGILAADQPRGLRLAADALIGRKGDYLALARQGANQLGDEAKQLLPAGVL